MDRVLRIACVAVAVILCVGRSSEAAAVFDHLAVRIYDLTGVADKEDRSALKRAGSILAEADVAVEWRNCSPKFFRGNAVCSTPPVEGELVVRLVRAPGIGSPATLGEAFIDKATGKGVLATVFVDRIEALAAVAKTNVLSMVGHVIAHEIGHLLLGTTTHADTGLMRQLWTLADLARDRAEDWVFSRADIDRLRLLRPRPS